MLLSQKLEQIACNNRNSQRSISEFLLKEGKKVGKYSMQRIADETFSSKSTLVRLAQKLGFSGWKEFMEEYQKEVHYLETHKTDVNINLPFTADNTILEIAGNIAAVKQEGIYETMEMLQADILDKAAAALSRARRISVFGNSVNRYLGESFLHKMLMIGYPVVMISQEEERFLAETMGPDDCAVIISYSGNNVDRNPTHMLPVLKEHGVTMIGLTSMGDNMVREFADYVLTIASHEKLYSKIGTFATESSTLFLLDMIFCCCFAKDYEKNLDYKVRTARAVEKRRYSTSRGIREDLEEDG